MRRISVLIAFLLLPLAQAAVLFESDWSTSGTGTSSSIVRDNNKWCVYGGSGLAVVPSTGLDFPTENVLQVNFVSGCTVPATGDPGYCSGSIRYGQPWCSGMSIPAIGESRYYRWYFRAVWRDNLQDDQTHPIQDGNAGSQINWELSARHNDGGPGYWTPQIQLHTTNGGDYYQWNPPPLPKHETYRFEVRIHRISATQFNLHARVYDSADNLVYDDDDYQSAFGSTTLASNPTLTFNDVNNLDGLNAGVNGLDDPYSGDFVYAYQGAFCVRDDTWCGPYGASDALFSMDYSAAAFPGSNWQYNTSNTAAFTMTHQPGAGPSGDDAYRFTLNSAGPTGGDYSIGHGTYFPNAAPYAYGDRVYLKWRYRWLPGTDCRSYNQDGSGDLAGTFRNKIIIANDGSSSTTSRFIMTAECTPDPLQWYWRLQKGGGVDPAQTVNYPMTSEWTDVQVELQYSSAPGMNDGAYRVWVDNNNQGVPDAEATGISLYADQNPGYMRFGAYVNNGEYADGNIGWEHASFQISDTFDTSWDQPAETPADTTPPTATITAPTAGQVLAAGTTQTTLSVTTNEAATCRWSTTDQAYRSMPNTMTGAGSTSHTSTLTGLVNGGSNTTYVRCQDTAGNNMTSSQSRSYSVANPAAPVCGNGVLEAGESCDNGAGNGACPAACSSSCTANMCGGSGPTITVDSTYAGYSTSHINDDIINAGSLTTGTWASAESGNPHWIELTFPSPVAMNGVTLHWALNEPAYMTSREIHIQHWNGSNWQTITTMSNTGSVASSTASFTSSNTTRYRLYQPSNQGHANYPVVLWITELDYTLSQGTTPSARVGDLNGDGNVNMLDVIQIIANFKRKQNYDAGADINNDGTVNVLDMVLLAREWGSGSAEPDTTPPTASITAPTAGQVLPAGTTQTTLSVTTNEAATCRWSTSDVAYGSMPNAMTGAGSTSHTSTLTGLTNGQSYTRYVRCQDTAQNNMTSSQSRSFSVANVAPVCGNGAVESGEQCDDGGSNGACPASCSATCTTNSCGSGTGALDAVPAGWNLVREWNNPATLTPTNWTISSIPTANGDSQLSTSGYTGAPPIGGPATREGTFYGGSEGRAIGRLGTSFPATNAVAFVHVFQIPSTYPWSTVYGGNKVAFLNPIGGNRAYTWWRAAANFEDDIQDRTDERKVMLALEGFSPVQGLDTTVELELDTWITTTVILDNRGGPGNGIARLYVKLGDGPHVLSGEHTGLTFPGDMTGFYSDHTNNGRAGSLIPYTGSLYDAYMGIFTP